jgi:soluble lytic murein transglycosylase-like protein
VALRDPKLNVMFGAAYVAYLRSIFKSRSELYLAAYNMGSVNLKNRLKGGERPQIYAGNINRELMKLKLELRTMLQTYRQTTVIAGISTPKTFVLE